MLGNTILAQHHMEVKTVETILTLFNEKSVFYVLETADGRFGSENGQRILAEANMENVSKKMQQLTADILLDPIVLPMSEYNGQSIFKIAYHCADADISEQLTSALGGIAKIVQFNNIPGLPITIGEISDPDVNKGNAMMDVCNYYNKTAKDCIAFGDSMNDAEIILAAGTGIAMGNADQQLKDIADMICDSCENDGIAKALCKLSII